MWSSVSQILPPSWHCSASAFGVVFLKNKIHVERDLNYYSSELISWSTPICSSAEFPSESAVKAQNRVKLMLLGRVCWALSFFASVHMFFMARMREAEDEWRPESCSMQGLELANVPAEKQCLGIVAVMLLLAWNNAWVCVTARVKFRWEESFLKEMEMWGRTWSVLQGKGWRLYANLEISYPRLGGEDASRDPWKETWHTELLAQGPVHIISPLCALQSSWVMWRNLL